MKVRKLLLLGGSGFIGNSVAEQLTRRGIFVTVPSRRRERARELLILPTTEVVDADVMDERQLDELVCGQDAVINLIGILHGEFERVHIELPRRVADACVRSGTSRLIQMSALNASVTAPSTYLQSRDRGEAAVMEIAKHHPALKVTFFRPSVVFGEHDHFLNLFARMIRMAPFIPLGSPAARFQPVWVEDVARALVQCLDMGDTFGHAYPLVGPRVYTLRQLLELTMEITGHRRPILELGSALSAMQAAVFERLAGKLITRDNLRSMSIPSVSDVPFPAMFGEAHAIENIVPAYMRGDTSRDAAGRARYDSFRHRAGRSL